VTLYIVPDCTDTTKIFEHFQITSNYIYLQASIWIMSLRMSSLSSFMAKGCIHWTISHYSYPVLRKQITRA